MWCIGKITPEYRERMYDLTDLYNEPYDPERPKIGIDEKSKQLLENIKIPIPMKKGSPEKYDYEYKRKGTANIFVAVDPQVGKRVTMVTNQRTKKDFAYFMKHLVDEVFRDAKQLRVIVDNLNTHFKSSFDETFDEEEANRILSKIEFHYTPKHASWLNVAEIEINAMDTQCTGRRMKNKDFLIEEVEAWTNKRNEQKKKIDWRFTRKDADRKLSKHYVSQLNC